MNSPTSNAKRPVFVYSEDYNMDLGPHVFPSVKFGFVRRLLAEDDRFSGHRFVVPEPISLEQARTIHDRRYMEDLTELQQSRRVHRSELPLTRPIVDAFFLASGGTLCAAREALEYGSAMNISGGFHHAYGDHAEGFCYLNDVAIAARVLRKEKAIKKALVIDLDVHQGNGTAKIFQRDRRVFTFSIHEEDNYPIKERSNLDIGLEAGCGDDEYLTLLSDALEKIRGQLQPDMIFYLAGVDPYEDDVLGGIKLTMDGMSERDRLVRDFMPDIPLVTVLAGGYARNTDDTVQLHFRTCEVLAGFR